MRRTWKESIGWSIHNLIGHPMSEIVYLMGFGTVYAERLSNWIHDATVPNHESGTGRG